MQLKKEKDNNSGRRGRRPLQVPKSNLGITLIALIITIIVLLILAGVTLNMVMGENGIFSKANSAKEQTQKSTAEETIKLAVLENNAKDAAGETSLNELELKVEISKKLKELGYTVAEDNNTVTYYGDKTINIEDYFEKDTEKTTGITAKDVQRHPDWYYGKTVDYTSLNGQNDWRIFHSDGTNIYLITGNYVKVTVNNGNINPLKLNEGTNMQISSGGQNYRVNWSSSKLPSFNTDVSDDIISKFKINTSVFDINSHKSNENAQCVSTLLNPSYWTGYIDNSKGNNQTAIGGPTVQLWIDSWKARYSGQEVYCDSANENGYYVGTSSSPSSYSMSLNQSNGGELYFANNYSALTDGNNTVDYYWIASPSAGRSYYLLGVNYSGDMDAHNYDDPFGALRPIVCLQSNISLK